MKKLKLKNVIVRVFALLMALIFVFVVPSLNIGIDNDMEYIYGSFIGKKSPYNGMIEIWNIDSFESGLKSKVSYLEMMAKSFQKKYKGIYVMVRNLTMNECENLLKTGEIPDIVSCSYGVSQKIKGYVCEFEKRNDEVFSGFLEAGKGESGKLYGLAWCFGFYALISTKSKIEKAGKEFSAKLKLLHDGKVDFVFDKKK